MALAILHPQKKDTPILGVLFDMDGVILDTEILYSRFWQEAAQALGYPMTREQALGMRSLNHAAGQEQLTGYFGEGVSYDCIRQERMSRMDAFVADHGVAAKPGLEELLDALDARGIPAAITTSSPADRVKSYLSPLGLLHRFHTICTAADVARGKPEPDIYLHGAQMLGLSAKNCLAIEDSPAGILSASRAGCYCVMVPDQDKPDAQTESLLFAEADSLLDVIALLP